MREHRPVPIEPNDVSWHDGIIVEIQLAGFAEESQELTLVLDLYCGNDAKSQRRRYLCIGTNLSRFLLSGDIARLLGNRSAGNIDFMRLDHMANTEILVVCLFGGMIEVEAASFQLTETQS